jgi:hypothetical protein
MGGCSSCNKQLLQWSAASCGSLLASTSCLPGPMLHLAAALNAACMCNHTWWQPDAYVPWSLPRHDMQHATSQGCAADYAPGPDRLLLAAVSCVAASADSWCCVADGTTGRRKQVCRSNLLSAATIRIDQSWSGPQASMRCCATSLRAWPAHSHIFCAHDSSSFW